jgi:hypothetical protein
MMSRGYGYLLLLDRVGLVGGLVEHSEGKGEESAVAMRGLHRHNFPLLLWDALV